MTRTCTECVQDICGTVTVTEGSSETCTDDHHHGPGEKCNEGGDDYDDGYDEKKHYHGKGENNSDDGDEEEKDEHDDKDKDY